MAEIPFKDLPLYSYDYDANFPPVATAFKERHRGGRCRAIRDAGVQPIHSWRAQERHRLGQPAVAEEFLHAKAVRRSSERHQGRSAPPWRKQHLRSIMAFCNSPLMNAIEAYIQFEPGLITEDGRVTNKGTERVYTVLPRNP